MVLNSLSPSKENTQSFSQTEQNYWNHQRNALGTFNIPEENIPPRPPTHVSKESCVTLSPSVIGSRVHQPASRIPIGYQEKHFQQPPKQLHTTGLPARLPEPLPLQMGGGDGDSHPLQKTTRTILSICGQTNIRVYNRYVLCFPIPGGSETRPRIDAHLRQSLDALANRRPEFAGQLELAATVENQHTPKSGYICLKQSPSFTIPLESHDVAATFGWTFSELRQEGFPAKAFVHPGFELPCDVTEKGDLQAARIRALYIEGGLLLGVWLHHGLADGTGVGDFLESFAAATRGHDVGISQCLELDLVNYEEEIKQIGSGKTFKELIAECPEYGIHPQLSNPTGAIEREGGTPVGDIEKTGKIFVFSKDILEDIKKVVNQYLRPGSSDSSSSSDSQREGASCYTVLAALTWAHVAKARLEVEQFAPPTVGLKTARLMNPVNWKLRALKDATQDYYGNATALAITQVPVSVLLDVCDGNLEALAKLVGEIKRSINAIDDEFVCRRLATYYAAPDPRYLGLDIDPRTQQDLGFNTWRGIGGDTEWWFPGMKSMKPEAIRRAQGAWNMAGSLIMPARSDSGVFELLVTLPKVSMNRLLEDKAYRAKTVRVID